MYTFIAMARFHKASAGKNLFTHSVRTLEVPNIPSSHLDEEALKLA